MLQRLQIEWIKLRRYRTFWVLGIMYLVGIFLLNYLLYWIQEETYREEAMKGVLNMMESVRPYEFPNVWHTTAYSSSFLLYIPGLMMIIFMSNEYQYKTHRQNIIDGWSRYQFISAKLGLVVIGAVISTVMVALTALFFGIINREPFSAEKMINIFYFFIQALTYITVSLLITLLIKRTGLAIGIFFMYGLVFENAIAGLMNKYLNNSGRWLPLESVDNLVQFPILEKAQRMVLKPFNTTALLIVALVYLGLYLYLTTKKFQRDDL